jgi:DNA invertase Pin-like site-specific DNA recombinase
MTVYAYVRVSTDMQTVENQRELIKSRGYKIDQWLGDEATSGTVDWKIRDIYNAVNDGVKGDTIVVAELSRLGRSLKQVLEIVEICKDKGITLVCIREGIEMNDDNPTTKLLISILGSLSEMERNLISQRTKDALKRKKENGVKLGRPKASKDIKRCKLYDKENEVRALIKTSAPMTKIAEQLGVHPLTLSTFCKELDIQTSRRYKEYKTRPTSAEMYVHNRIRDHYVHGVPVETLAKNYDFSIQKVKSIVKGLEQC